MVGHSDQHAAVLDHGDDAGSRERAENAAASAAETASADDHRGDHFQFQAQTRDRVTFTTEHRELVQPGHSDKHPRERVDEDPRADHVDATQSRGRFVGPDREHVAAEDGVAEHQRHDECQDQHDPDAR